VILGGGGAFELELPGALVHAGGNVMVESEGMKGW